MHNSVRTLVHHVRKANVDWLAGMTSKRGHRVFSTRRLSAFHDPLLPFLVLRTQHRFQLC